MINVAAAIRYTRTMSDAGINRAYVRVLVIWLAVLAGLWWLQHAFL